jgi:hypothetical protein
MEPEAMYGASTAASTSWPVLVTYGAEWNGSSHTLGDDTDRIWTSAVACHGVETSKLLAEQPEPHWHLDTDAPLGALASGPVDAPADARSRVRHCLACLATGGNQGRGSRRLSLCRETEGFSFREIGLFIEILLFSCTFVAQNKHILLHMT